MLNFENLLHPPATKGEGVPLSKEYLELDTWKNNNNSFFLSEAKISFLCYNTFGGPFISESLDLHILVFPPVASQWRACQGCVEMPGSVLLY